MRGKPHPGRTRRQAAGRAIRHAAHARRGPLKHLVQVRKQKRVTAVQSVTIFETHSNTIIARNNRSI